MSGIEPDADNTDGLGVMVDHIVSKAEVVAGVTQEYVTVDGRRRFAYTSVWHVAYPLLQGV